MTGDIQDFVRRMRAVLPRGWFSDAAVVLDGVLGSIGVAWQAIYTLIQTVNSLARIATASGPFMDMISTDFFGTELPRLAGESDTSFRSRITEELLRSRASREALNTALNQLTGFYPVIVEPARPEDTGGYSRGGVGYCAAGAWGSLILSNACFVTAYRPMGMGISDLAGYGSGGVVAYGDLDMVATGVTDARIFACAAQILPLGCTAWLRISG